MPESLPEFKDTTPFWYWINERHKIYTKRAAGEPGPWTDDPVLRDYRFCNVFRELDTVTIWVEKSIRQKYADSPNLWFLLSIARYINWPESLADILHLSWEPHEHWYPDEVIDILAERRRQGKKTFGSAYVLTNGGTTLPKEEYIVNRILDPLWQRHHGYEKDYMDTRLGVSLETTWNYLRQFQGMGPFISYEVTTDLRHTRYLRNAPDIMSWANAGPGALRGLNRLLGRVARAPLSPRIALGLMRCLLAYANSPDSPLGAHVPRPLEMRDIEHSLCETDKYLRAVTGEGRPRATYNWRTANGTV